MFKKSHQIIMVLWFLKSVTKRCLLWCWKKHLCYNSNTCLGVYECDKGGLVNKATILFQLGLIIYDCTQAVSCISFLIVSWYQLFPIYITNMVGGVEEEDITNDEWKIIQLEWHWNESGYIWLSNAMSKIIFFHSM